MRTSLSAWTTCLWSTSFKCQDLFHRCAALLLVWGALKRSGLSSWNRSWVRVLTNRTRQCRPSTWWLFECETLYFLPSSSLINTISSYRGRRSFRTKIEWSLLCNCWSIILWCTLRRGSNLSQKLSLFSKIIRKVAEKSNTQSECFESIWEAEFCLFISRMSFVLEIYSLCLSGETFWRAKYWMILVTYKRLDMVVFTAF